jgi:hypothetical protein
MSMRLPRAFSCALVLLAPLVVSCADNVSPASTLVITTDSTRYSAHGSDGAWVWVSIRNVSSHAVQLAGCGGFNVYAQIERAQLSGWVTADTPVCSRIYEPTELDPAQGLGVGAIPKAAGSYRIRAPLFADSSHVTRSVESSAVFDVY